MAHKLSELLVLDKEEVELLYRAFGEWWIPRIKQKDPKINEYNKLNKTMRYFLEEQENR